MKTANFATSSCRYCRYYNPEGRRGGACQQLGVPVQAHWKACVLAARPFTAGWESLEDVVRLETSLSLNCSTEHSSVKTSESEPVLAAKQTARV